VAEDITIKIADNPSEGRHQDSKVQRRILGAGRSSANFTVADLYSFVKKTEPTVKTIIHH